MKKSSLLKGLEYNMDKNINYYDVWLKIIEYKNSILLSGIIRKNRNENKTKKENKSLEKIFNDSIAEIIYKLNDLVNKKEEKIYVLRNSMSFFFEIINNYDIDLIIKDIHFTLKELKMDSSINIKSNLISIFISLSLESKIKKIISSILWILDNFINFMNFSYSSFYESIKNFYNFFTISKLDACINYLKEKKIIENFEVESNFVELLYLMNGQFKKHENAINFCVNKTSDGINNIIEYIKNNGINFLNKNDINDFKSCCQFINKIINEKIDEDKRVILVMKDEFNRDKSIFQKFKNYLSFYKNIEELYKESTNINKNSFKYIIKNILDESEIIVDSNGRDVITCNISFFNDNKVKENLNYEELYEMNDYFSLNNYHIDNRVEKFINDLNRLIEKINDLYTKGYPFPKKLHLKLNKNYVYSIVDNKETDFNELINYFNSLSISFQNIWFEQCKENPILRFIYGKMLSLLYNAKKSNNISSNLKNDINNILSYILNNTIQEEVNDSIFIEENTENNVDGFLISISKYLNEILSKNKISLEKVLKESIIKEEFNYIKNGIYFILYLDDEYLEYNIINIYQEITGNYPINNTLLICNEEVSYEKIYSFLLSVFLCEYPILFILVNIESLNISLQNKIIDLIERLSKLFNERKSSFVIIGKSEELMKKINNLSKSRIIILEQKENKNIKYKYDNIEIISGSKSGLGRTSYIKHHIIYELKKNYVYFPVSGNFTRKEIINRLKNLNMEKNCNTYLHLDLKQSSLKSLIKEFLFKLLILKAYDINENIFYLGTKVNIIIELSYGFINYMDIFPFLKIFNHKHIDKLYPLRIKEQIIKIKDSNIQIVANILKLFYENKIGFINIDLESDILLTQEECQNILNKFFEEKKFDDNYYQRIMLIDFLAVQFKMFTECNCLKINLKEDNFKESNNIIIRSRPKIIEAIINSAILSTCGPFDKLINIEKESFQEQINFNEDNNNNYKIKYKDTDTINYDSIKGCLLFFNEDKEFFTIITNNPTNEDYNLFLSLYNTQDTNSIDDFNINEKNKLINYGDLTHLEYIEELRKIFDVKREIDIGEIAKKNDNYIFTRDNFIKMILIYFRIKSDLPVVLMGETGCGKTSLIKMLSLIINRGKDKLKIMNMHGGIKDKDIINFIKNCEKESREEKKEDIQKEINKFKESEEKIYYKENVIEEEIKQKINEEKIWIFFDEINTCDSLGLINEIMISKSINGEKIDKNFVFIASCNPYRKITKKMKQSGLIYPYKDNNINNNKKELELVYNVNPLPISLINYIFNFGSLSKEDEKMYVLSIIERYFDKMKKGSEKEIKIYGLINVDSNKIEIGKNNIINCIVFCHNYLKEKYDDSLISLRDIRRFIIFYDWFLKYLINESTMKDIYNNDSEKLLKDCLNLTIYLCYYLRLSDVSSRKDFKIKMTQILERDFLEIPLKEEKYITQQFITEYSNDSDNIIVLNRTLREILLTMFICINTREPLIIVGKPGSGKTLSINCISNSMKGEYSENSYFRRK